MAALLLGNALLVVRLLPDSDLLAHVAEVAELVAYPILLAGAGLLYVHHRLTPDGGTAWLTTAAVFGSVQGMGYAAIRVAVGDNVSHHVLGLGVVDVAAALVLVVMLAAGRGRDPVDAVAAGRVHGVCWSRPPASTVLARHHAHPVGAALDVQPLLPLAALALYGVAAFLVLHRAPLPAWAAREPRGGGRGPGRGARAHLSRRPRPTGEAWSPRRWTSPARSLVGLTALRLVRVATTRIQDADRQVDELEAHVRAGEVLLHEVASTVAGIVAASHLVAATPHLAAADRQRLEALLDLERARLDRLLSRPGDEPVTEVDLDAVLSPVVLSHRIRGREVEWSPAGTRVLGRAGALTEVVDILLDNSAVHSGSRSVLVDAVANGDEVRLQVSDDGCGIPPELSASVLDWGTRGASSTGHGIGLSVAGRLVTDMGGRLDVHSDGQTGTTVAVTLPLADSATRASTILDRRVG